MSLQMIIEMILTRKSFSAIVVRANKCFLVVVLHVRLQMFCGCKYLRIVDKNLFKTTTDEHTWKQFVTKCAWNVFLAMLRFLVDFKTCNEFVAGTTNVAQIWFLTQVYGVYVALQPILVFEDFTTDVTRHVISRC